METVGQSALVLFLYDVQTDQAGNLLIRKALVNAEIFINELKSAGRHVFVYVFQIGIVNNIVLSPVVRDRRIGSLAEIE